MTTSRWDRIKIGIAALALSAALVGGTASAAQPTAPNPTACEHSKAAAKVDGKQAKAKTKAKAKESKVQAKKAAANSAVKCSAPAT